MPVGVVAMALLLTAWLSADGVPASEPGQLNESLLTITETVEAPPSPAPKSEDVRPAPPPSAKTEASPAPPEDEDEDDDKPKPAEKCDKQVTFTPQQDQEEDAAREAKEAADDGCPEAEPQKKKRRHRRKSTDLRNSDGSPALTNPGLVDVLPGPSSASGVPNFIIRKFRVPPFLLPIYQAAGIEYGIRWEVLAAINEIETDYGRNLNVSSAGAVGWMQFIPSTWRMYGTDANEDGRKDPYNPVDAIFAAARYLAAAGYEDDVRRAIFAYNHADWYVDSVLLRTRLIAGVPADLVGSLTGLTEGRFPVYARARYADDQAEGIEASRGIGIFARQGSPVVAVNDGVIRKVAESERLGKYVVLEDAYGNRFTYAHLGSVSSFYPVPKSDGPQSVSPTKAREDEDPKPTAPASAGSQPDPKAQSEDETSPAPAPDAPSASLPVKERLFAHPGAPGAKEAGGLEQTLDARARKSGKYETFDAYFSRPIHLDPSKVRLRRLEKGSRVIGGTVLGRVGSPARGGGSRLSFSIRPGGKGAPNIDPKPILDGWKLLEATAIYRASGRNVLYAKKGDSVSVGQVLLWPKRLLERRVLSDERIEIYACGRDDIKSGQVDRRVLATLEYLAESGLSPTVTSLKCGHGFYTKSGNVSEHSSGSAVDIAKINGIPILGHQEAGGVTEQAVRRLMRLQGTMQPHQVISLLELGGPTLAMGDHADHIHVGFRAKSTRIFKPGQWINLLDRLREIENPVVPVKPSEFSLPVKKKRAGGGD